MDQTELTCDVRERVRSLGAALVGVAGVERLEGAPAGHRAEDFLPGARSVVVIALPILPAYARHPEFLKDSALIPDAGTRQAVGEHIYRRCCYEFLNMELERLAFYTARHLEESGHPSIHLPATYGASFTWSGPPPSFTGPFSHRHAAVAAGLGRFGLNNLVLTPQYGPLQRFVTVITTAELDSDPLIDDEICLGVRCSVCRDQCPNDCFGPEIREHDSAGAPARVWAMDKDRCGKRDHPDHLHCTQQCLFMCPLGHKRRPTEV